MYYWRHSGVYGMVRSLNVDYAKVSNPYYFTNFDSKYDFSTNDCLVQRFSVGYTSQNWDLMLASEHFQAFSGIDWDGNYYQTLESRLRYLYNPYRNQGPINLHNSMLLQSDYISLFQGRGYSSGHVTPANQMVSGSTTRVYGDNMEECFNTSVGQVCYSQPTYNEGQNGIPDKIDYEVDLIWAGSTYYKINNFWGCGGVQYSTHPDALVLGNSVLEYRTDSEIMIQLSHRYAFPEYIQTTLPQVANPDYQHGISQTSIITS